MIFLRFLASGGVSTLLDLLFFGLLVFVLPPLWAYPLSYSLCVIIRYFLDARLTFATERLHARQFIQYFLANALVMGLGLLAFQGAHHYFPAMVAKILSVPLTILSGFIIMRSIVFRPSREAS